MSPAQGTTTPEAGAPTLDDVQLRRAARRATGVLFAVQSMSSAGIIAGATVASIVGAEIGGRTALAGVPSALAQIGTAIGALVWSLASDRLGRRVGLGTGILVGALGAAGVVTGIALHTFAILVPALLLMGSGPASAVLGRFVAAEVHQPSWRGRAVSLVVLGGTVGSVLGPALVAPASALAGRLGLDTLAGPYGVTVLVYLIGSTLLYTLLRPEPKQVGAVLEQRYPHASGPTAAPRPWSVLLRDPGVATAIPSMVLAQGVMVMMMGITSLHMKVHLHPLADISLVFSAHTLGMYAPSLVTGWLVDRFGRRPIIAVGTALLVAACALAPLSYATGSLVVALFVLGLGWNLCFVGGSALLADRLTPSEKGRVQGVNDLTVGLVAAGASLTGGLVFAAAGYGVMGIIGVVASVVLAAVVAYFARPAFTERWRAVGP